MADSLTVVLSVATGLALAAAAGFRAFVPLLAAGLAIHFGYVEPARGFDWLGEPVVLGALSVATVAEIAAYYVPGVDHVLDLLGAPVAVVAGILAAAGVMVGLPDWLRWLTAIGAGGVVATAGHALNAVGRAKTGAASGGMGNPVYATAELGGSVLLAALALLVPVIALVAIVVLVAWALKRRRRRPVGLPDGASLPRRRVPGVPCPVRGAGGISVAAGIRQGR
jgi:hypothetical protein